MVGPGGGPLQHKLAAAAQKDGLEAIQESLAIEVKPFGIKVTLVEPGAYATEFGGPSSGKRAAGLDVYADLKAQVFEGIKGMKRGDPRATVDAMFKLVDAENPPLRLFLGSHNLAQVPRDLCRSHGYLGGMGVGGGRSPGSLLNVAGVVA